MIIDAPDSDGQDILFAEDPSVAAQVAAKVKFRQFAGDAAASRLCCRHLELYFARHDRGRGGLIPEEARHRTKVSTGADHKSCLDLAIDEPAVPAPLYRVERHAFPDASPTTAQKIFVKLTAQDAVADGATVGDVNLRLFDAAQAKTGDWLQNTPVRVGLGINVERLEHQRRDPSAAKLVAREGARSISRVSSPDCRSPQAQEEPAGPPPTIKTSQESIVRRLPYLGPGWHWCTDGCASLEPTDTGLQ